MDVSNFLVVEPSFLVGHLSSSSSSSSSSGSFTTVWLLLFLHFRHSLSPFFCVPPRYFLPIITWLSCFALTSNSSHASLAIPWLKNFLFSFSHTTAASIHVGPFFGLCFIQAASCLGKMFLLTFTLLCSSIIMDTMSATRFKNLSGRFNWTKGWMAAS